MIYLDNAATTCHKPPSVVAAVSQALTSFGGAGRGVHGPALAAGFALLDTREKVAAVLGVPAPCQVAFAQNATMALNCAIGGLLRCEERALTTAASHNSVLRPLFRARDERGCTLDIAPILPDGSLDFAAYQSMLVRPVRLVVATHASNLTGDVYDIARMARMAHEAGALFVLDAAQTAGTAPFCMEDLGVDVVCFTGHKGFFGPQGTGGLCVKQGIEVPPLLEGGSGIHSFDERQPCFMPEVLETGTQNAHGLAGLAAGIDFLTDVGIENVAAKVNQLTKKFEENIATIPQVEVQGGYGGIGRCGIVALSLGRRDPGEVADQLFSKYGIAARSGVHCAPLMHRALGTQDRGALRFSFSYFTTNDEIDRASEALAALL